MVRRVGDRGMSSISHTPVMVREILEFLAVRPGRVYVDATLGLGGHARAMLERMGGKGVLLGMDRDAEALVQAKRNLDPWRTQCRLVHGNFADLAAVAARQVVMRVDGILLDLGLSALQIENPERGFSFMHEGPLDMRMDRGQTMTAADVLASGSADELMEWLKQYGDEPDARKIAGAVVRERKQHAFMSTRQLADLVAGVKGGRRGKIHPATRTFQALRIVVNREIEYLEEALKHSVALLGPGGRLVVLSYHSLEDRTVKHFVKEHIGRWESLPAGGQRWMGQSPALRWLTPKPVMPSDEEIIRNPRARSAKLRAAERTE